MSMRYPGGLIASSPVNAAYPSGVWTQPQTAVYNNLGVWQRDPYFDFTTLLLHGDGTNGAQNNTFLDSSTNNFTITRNGNTTQGAFTPYTANGYWGNYFDGSSSLSLSQSTALSLGTGDFTVEAWVFPTANPASFWSIIDCRGSAANVPWAAGLRLVTGNLKATFFNGADIQGSANIPLNAWTHIAFVRSGTTLRSYVNGVLDINTTMSTNLTAGTTQYIGAIVDPAYSTGYLSNLRIVKGTAVYTSAFTPPTNPLTAITNTALLTCQSNRFIDNSTNNFTITRNGDTSVQQFNPFGLPTNWSAPVLGGSGYFDGTGDYLAIGSGSLTLNARTESFTFEAWMYTLSSSPGILFGSAASSSLYIYVTNQLYLGDGAVNNIGPVGTVNTGVWNYVAVSFDGTTYRMYLNGSLVGSSTTLLANAAVTPAIGAYNNGSTGLNGYVAGARLVKGSALYTGSTMTVPASPISTTGGTSFLLNFTNAGIFDNAQCNNLETVGNAQVSTSVVKYNTGSMAFDGSGDCLTAKETGGIFTFGTGDYTYECWLYTTTGATSQKTIFGRSNTGNIAVPYIYLVNGTGVLSLYYSSTIVSSTAAISANTWTHIAVCRANGTVRLFINGVLDGSVADTTNLISPDTLVIGGSGVAAANPFFGYIDDVRITKGYARYIGNFTPPIARFPNQG